MSNLQKQTVAQGFDPLGSKKIEKPKEEENKQQNKILFSSDLKQDFYIINKMSNQEQPKIIQAQQDDDVFKNIQKIFKQQIQEKEQQTFPNIKCIFQGSQVEIVITNFHFIISGDFTHLFQQNRLEYYIFPLQFILMMEKQIDKRTNQDIQLKDCRNYQFRFGQNNLDQLENQFNSMYQYCILDQGKQNLLSAYLIQPKLQAYEKKYIIEEEFKRQNLNIYNQNNQYEKQYLKYIDNSKYQHCSTYPNLLVLPYKLSDDEFQRVLKFRSQGRLPVLTYAYQQQKSKQHFYLWRCAQCLSGAVGNRSYDDELLFALFGEQIVVYDARSWVAAKANMLNGKGTENTKYYQNIDLIFLDIENIHKVRDSYKKLKTACLDQENSQDWFQNLYNSEWYDHISLILQGSLKVADSLQIKEQNVVVHCSDGWDRTSQLCALAQIFLDPYFRTFEGFMILVEKDFISFGYQFQKRNQHFKSSDDQQRAPVFIQFLDCVFQVMNQFPFSFEFNSQYLQFLAYHQYSCQFGTFLEDNHNNYVKTIKKTTSIWVYLNQYKDQFKNIYYDKDLQIQTLKPNSKQKCLTIWKDHFFYYDKDFFDQYKNLYSNEAKYTEEHKDLKFQLIKSENNQFKIILNDINDDLVKTQKELQFYKEQSKQYQLQIEKLKQENNQQTQQNQQVTQNNDQIVDSNNSQQDLEQQQEINKQ